MRQSQRYKEPVEASQMVPIIGTGMILPIILTDIGESIILFLAMISMEQGIRQEGHIKIIIEMKIIGLRHCVEQQIISLIQQLHLAEPYSGKKVMNIYVLCKKRSLQDGIKKHIIYYSFYKCNFFIF